MSNNILFDNYNLLKMCVGLLNMFMCAACVRGNILLSEHSFVVRMLSFKPISLVSDPVLTVNLGT